MPNWKTKAAHETFYLQQTSTEPNADLTENHEMQHTTCKTKTAKPKRGLEHSTFPSWKKPADYQGYGPTQPSEC